jgi:hypothetical protein
MPTLFNLHQKCDDEVVLLRPHDDFVLMDQDNFIIVGVDMLEPTTRPDVSSTDRDYPFERPIEGQAKMDHDRVFKLRAPKLKAGDMFRRRLYMLRWEGSLKTDGPHFRIDP